MSDYIFNGYYGYKNTGDDVFCVVADWGSRKYWKARNLAFVATELPVLGHPAKPIIPTVKRYPGQHTISRVISSLESVNMVYFGGSTLHSPQELWVNIFRKFRSHSVFAKSISASGVSIGPFKTSRAENEIRKLLSEMDFISVRDRVSFDIVEAMNIDTPLIQSFDPALLMLDVMQDKPNFVPIGTLNTRPTIGVSVCNYERYVDGDHDNEIKRIKFVKDTIKFLAAEGFKLSFFVFNGNKSSGDDRLTDEVIDSLAGYPYVEKISYDRDPCQVFNRISCCKAIFGIRLHSAILAYAASVPFVLIEYHRKCADFLDEIGYLSSCRVGDAATDPLVTANLLASFANSGSKELWTRSVEESRRLSMLNFTEAPYSN